MAPQNCSATHQSSYVRSNVPIPEVRDWRDISELSVENWPVKNQRSCGSCWTFSTVGTLEAQTLIHKGYLPNASEQQLVDCAGRFNNFGCNGGLPSQAFEYI